MGRETKYTYDNLNRLKEVEYLPPTLAGNPVRGPLYSSAGSADTRMRVLRETIMTMERPQIVRIDERSRGTFLERTVLGLNIFWTNDVDCPIGDDPQIAFLSNLCGTNDAGLNIGNLFDYAAGPDELFDGTEWERRYRTVATGCYSGEFYDARKWDTFPSLFFDHVSEPFFQITTNGDSLIRKLLQIDAIAYFISPKQPASVERLVELLNAPFDTSEALIEKSLDFFKLIGFSQADGDYFPSLLGVSRIS